MCSRLAVSALSLALIAFFASVTLRAVPDEQQKIKADDRRLAERMLASIHDALKKNYYDPSFHGIDVDARYKTYNERLQTVETLGGAFRVMRGVSVRFGRGTRPCGSEQAFSFRMGRILIACWGNWHRFSRYGAVPVQR
jgi:hypothetical protein